MIPYLLILDENTKVKLQFSRIPTKEDLKILRQKLMEDLPKFPAADPPSSESHPKAT